MAKTRAPLTITEDDFNSVANAAFDAFYKGDKVNAFKLDNMARRMNHALSVATTPRGIFSLRSGVGVRIKSPLEEAGLR
jgi:hypothetical protein